eukprot:934554-Rhodomonas_salina.1
MVFEFHAVVAPLQTAPPHGLADKALRTIPLTRSTTATTTTRSRVSWFAFDHDFLKVIRLLRQAVPWHFLFVTFPL